MARHLFDYPNVVGHGIGWKARGGERIPQQARVVLVKRKMEATALRTQDIIPLMYNGMLTDVVEVGHLRALQARTDRWRPAPGGVSIGHRLVTAGTLGCLVHDDTNGRLVILSNNHVMAASNQGKAGDPIYQPGIYDGGTEAIAELLRFTPIMFHEASPTCPWAKGAARAGNLLARLLGSRHRLVAVQEQELANRYDAAVAEPIDPGLVTPDIEGLREPTGIAREIALGGELWKSGRTTGVTKGQAIVVDATVDVDYDGQTARFEGQVVAGPMSQPGDSGSAVLDALMMLAGLLFAGSDEVTVISPIGPVMTELGLSL